ncbi:MAG: sigma-54 dependent transcriptional regulator [Bacteroidota bacterium]
MESRNAAVTAAANTFARIPYVCDMETENHELAPATLLRILVVDDDRPIRRMLSMCLEDAGHVVTGVGDAEDALSEVRQRVFDLAFLDLRLGIVDGNDVLRELRRLAPKLRVVMMTAYGTIQSAVESIRLGAVEYLAKPFDCVQARVITARYGELIDMERRLLQLEIGSSGAAMPPVSASPAMQRVLDVARNAATSEATILLTGESGTGKSLLARAMHAWSPRASAPFITVSCPAIPIELFESELFGHRRGAFTGAIRDTHGRVAEADGGTLFLDEIGELPFSVQARLLHFLQDRSYERVGDPSTQTANVRLIAATNRDLYQAVASGAFRDDLFYRLNVITLELPPLRERSEDIPFLAEMFLRHFSAENKREISGFTSDAMELLTVAHWPGNIRELRNAIERAIILGSDSLLDTHAFSPEIRNSEHKYSAGERLTLEQLQEAHIRRVLANSGSLQEAADVLGIDQATLWRKRKQYGL